jgi:hypothetical protein
MPAKKGRNRIMSQSSSVCRGENPAAFRCSGAAPQSHLLKMTLTDLRAARTSVRCHLLFSYLSGVLWNGPRPAPGASPGFFGNSAKSEERG